MIRGASVRVRIRLPRPISSSNSATLISLGQPSDQCWYSAYSESWSRTNFEPLPGWKSMCCGARQLPDRPADREGQVGRPGVEDVDRVLLRDPLADRPAPGARAGPVVPLGDVIAPVGQLQGDRDRHHRPQRPAGLAQPGRVQGQQEPRQADHRRRAIIVDR